MLRIPTNRAGRLTLALTLVMGLGAFGLLGVFPAGSESAAQAQDTRPNVLLIVTDDQRTGMSMMPKTLQYFAREGRSYRQAYVTTALCCPSRASIMTGRFVHNHGTNQNSVSPDFDHSDTLHAQLQAQGYRTALFGKFFNAWPVSTPPPFFDDYAMANSGFYNLSWGINGTVQRLPGYHTEIIGDQAVDFIEARRDTGEPWMMMLTPFAPHVPSTPEPAYANAPVSRYVGNPATLERDRSDKPKYVRDVNYRYRHRGRNQRIRQFRSLMSVDDMVTRVMGALRRTGQDNTIAVFISDNGVMWGEHGLLHKRVPYTPAIKVPFFMRWPGRVPAGSIDRRMVANIDITPTILRAIGAPWTGRDGRDLLDSRWRRDRMLLEHSAGGRVPPWASTRTKNYQYVEYYDQAGRVTFREYYDLRRDPWQLTNLYGDSNRRNNPPIAPLRDQLARDRVCVATACP